MFIFFKDFSLIYLGKDKLNFSNSVKSSIVKIPFLFGSIDRDCLKNFINSSLFVIVSKIDSRYFLTFLSVILCFSVIDLKVWRIFYLRTSGFIVFWTRSFTWSVCRYICWDNGRDFIVSKDLLMDRFTDWLKIDWSYFCFLERIRFNEFFYLKVID